MIKQIQEWKLGNKMVHCVVVKSFPGTTTSDMKHYLKPTRRKNPQHILHIGTSDLRDQNPNMDAENIVHLVQTIESETNARVILLELVSRSDNISYESAKTVNRKVKKFCNQNNWELVQHQKITSNDLNKKGLHLNDKGNDC